MNPLLPFNSIAQRAEVEVDEEEDGSINREIK